jgi:hypothetical protein
MTPAPPSSTPGSVALRGGVGVVLGLLLGWWLAGSSPVGDSGNKPLTTPLARSQSPGVGISPTGGEGQRAYHAVRAAVAANVVEREQPVARERQLRLMAAWEKAVADNLAAAESQGEPSLPVIREALLIEGIPRHAQTELTRLIYVDIAELARFEGWEKDMERKQESARRDYAEAMATGVDAADVDQRIRHLLESSEWALASERRRTEVYYEVAVRRLKQRSGIDRDEFFSTVLSLRPKVLPSPVRTEGIRLNGP